MKSALAKNLVKYHHKRWLHIRAHLKNFVHNKNDHQLHQLRIEAKQITALYHFIQSCQPDFNSDILLKPLQKIFKLSGKLRDYRNAKAFCARHHIKEEAFSDDKKKQANYLKKISKKHRKYRRKFETLETAARRQLEEIQNGQLKLYLHAKKEETVGMLLQNTKTKDLHELRKKIKELFYLAQLSSGERKGIINKDDLAKLDKLQDDIGKWHDISKFRRKVQDDKALKPKPRLSALIGEEKKLLHEIRKTANYFAG